MEEIKCIKFPKIPQFEQLIPYLKKRAQHVGKDENGNNIWNNMAKMPKITFRGSVKLHGCNCSFAYNNKNGLVPQSREKIVSEELTNYNFWTFFNDRKELFQHIIDQIVSENNIDLDKNTVVVYGEYCGGSIQKKVALKELDKLFVIFAIRIKPNVAEFFEDSNEEERRYPSTWLSIGNYSYPKERVFNTTDFKQWEIVVDLANPRKSLIFLNKIVDEVEKRCPVAYDLGSDGIGEGIVWVGYLGDEIHRFKTKGGKHTKSNTKTVIRVDPINMKSIEEFVKHAVTEERVKQGIDSIGSELIEMKHIGIVLKWVMKDINIEEKEVMEASALTTKDISGYCVQEIKNIFLEFMERQL